MTRKIYVKEQHSEDPRLKRTIHHDSESKKFAFDTTGLQIVNVNHQRLIPILDQGQVGSCTGNAGIGCINTAPFVQNPVPIFQPNEDGALALYSAAEEVDGNGSYPPNDRGSSGLSIAKVLSNPYLKIISGYQHCFTLNDALKALSQYPVITGTNWHEAMYTPDADGRVHPTGKIVGGHEYVAYKVDVDKGQIWFCNSWGSAWGIEGTFYMTWADYATLLAESGDVTVLIPNNVTPPTPMKVNNKVAASTKSLIESFEGLSLKPYKDQGGTWTIGYGSTVDVQGSPVTESTPPLTQAQADYLFSKQVQSYADTVNKVITITLDQNQFDACTSLCYNIGQSAFTLSTVAKECDAGNIAGAAQAFLLWDKVDGAVSANLLARRNKEMKLFLQ